MSKSNQALLVTGASGHLGRRVVELLLEAGAGRVIATTRKPESLADLAAKGAEIRRADFDDEAGLADAFKGATRALLISTDALDRPGRRAEQHTRAVRALKAAGVQHIVYTSAAHADRGATFEVFADHRASEDAVVASGLDYTLLRNSLYADLFLQSLGGAVASGQLVDARGAGAAAFVTREDCARAAAAALSRDVYGKWIYDVTGPESLTSDDVAKIVSSLANKPIAHQSIPADALSQGLQQHGFPAFVADLFVRFDVAIAKGELAVATTAVEHLTGRPAQRLADFLTANQKAFLPA